MQAAMKLAGYEASEADSLRKAIAKKKSEKLTAHRKKFIQGAHDHAGISKRDAGLIFKDWENFARYGFNKSHAADYGVIAVQTAYLKYHYPIEYMTALLSAWKNDMDRVSAYVAECRTLGIEVLPPDVNTSAYDFSIEDQSDGKSTIRFGLGAIKNVGEGPVSQILEARADGPFVDLTDFIHRVDLRHVGRRALECLIKVGSLDRFGSRLALLQDLERIIAVSSGIFRAKEAGQLMLFLNAKDEQAKFILTEAPYVDKREELNWERELLGVYVSDHPLSPYQKLLAEKVTHFSHQLEEANEQETVIVAGMVDRFRQHMTKKGNNMGFVTLEDLYGKVGLVIFPQVWEQVYHLIEMDKVLLAEGRVDKAQGEPKLLVNKLSQVSLRDLRMDGTETKKDKVVEEKIQEDDFLEDFLPDLPFDENDPQDFNGIAEDETQEFVEEDAANSKNETDLSSQSSPDSKTEEESQLSEESSQPVNEGDDFEFSEFPLEETIASSADTFHVYKPDLPQPEPLPNPDLKPRCIFITLEPCGDKNQDIRRLRRIHDILVSRPGRDQFAFRIRENNYWYEITFPNITTGLTDPLIRKLEGLMGSNNISIAHL